MPHKSVRCVFVPEILVQSPKKFTYPTVTRSTSPSLSKSPVTMNRRGSYGNLLWRGKRPPRSHRRLDPNLVIFHFAVGRRAGHPQPALRTETYAGEHCAALRIGRNSKADFVEARRPQPRIRRHAPLPLSSCHRRRNRPRHRASPRLAHWPHTHIATRCPVRPGLRRIIPRRRHRHSRHRRHQPPPKAPRRSPHPASRTEPRPRVAVTGAIVRQQGGVRARRIAEVARFVVDDATHRHRRVRFNVVGPRH